MTAKLQLELANDGSIQASFTNHNGTTHTVKLAEAPDKAMTQLWRLLAAQESARGGETIGQAQSPTQTMLDDMSDPRWGDLVKRIPTKDKHLREGRGELTLADLGLDDEAQP